MNFGITYFLAMVTRDELKRLCSENKHSFDERIELHGDCVFVRTVIGGDDNGTITHAHIYPNQVFAKRLREHY